MGACATKFNVLKDAGDAPAPEVVTKDISAVEEEIKKDEMAAVKDEMKGEAKAAAEDNEANRQSLEHLLENEGEAIPEQVKQHGAPLTKNQENENIKCSEAVADVPDKAETEKVKSPEAVADASLMAETDKVPATEVLKAEIDKVPATEVLKAESEIIPATEAMQPETSEEKKIDEKVVEDKQVVEYSNKPDEKSVDVEKPKA